MSGARPGARRTRAGALGLALALGLTTSLSAQSPGVERRAPSADSAAYARAQALVSSGDGAAGRAVVDSVLARTPSGALRYAEGLYWRATLAASALDAERDYRRVAVEYPLSPRVPAALTRLAQLEMARGDRALARRHLERLLGEYPPAADRAGAWYWLARLDFESGEIARGCTSLDSARASAPAGNVELANQIAGEARQCTPAPWPDARGRPLPPKIGVTADTAPRPPATTAAAESRAATKMPIRPKTEYTVQVGAYPKRATADKVRAGLAAKGYAARVVPRGKLFGVRVGRYAARADAERTAARLKAAKQTAIVVDAEPR